MLACATRPSSSRSDGRAEAPGLAPDRHGAGDPPAGDERREEPRAGAVRLSREVALRDQHVEAVGQHERPAPLDQLQQRPAVGPAGGPGVHEVLGVGVPMEQGEGDLGG